MSKREYEEKHVFLEIPAVPITKGGGRSPEEAYKVIQGHIPKDFEPLIHPALEFNAIFEFKKGKPDRYKSCDVDNLLKTVIDAVKGKMFIGDDRIINTISAKKKLSYRDMTTIHIATERNMEDETEEII